jgi:hypothetical protein
MWETPVFYSLDCGRKKRKEKKQTSVMVKCATTETGVDYRLY